LQIYTSFFNSQQIQKKNYKKVTNHSKLVLYDMHIQTYELSSIKNRISNQ